VSHVKQRSSVVAFAVILLPSRPSVAQVQPSFPKPSGPFDVGRLEIDVTDASREEGLTDDPTDKRRLLVSLYYPAAVPTAGKRGPYGTPQLAAVWPFFTEERRAWLSPGYAGVPVADGRFPVLLFSPGLGNLTLYYSTLLSTTSRVADSSSRRSGIPTAPKSSRFPTARCSGVTPPAAQMEFRQANREPSSNDSAPYGPTINGLCWISSRRGTRSTRCCAVTSICNPGVFGHSLGGAAAAQAAHVDRRIDAALNMDGAMFGTVTTEGSRVPLLLLEAERPVLSDAELQQVGMTREQADALITSIVNVWGTTVSRSRQTRSRKLERSKHNTFMTDLLFFTTALPAARRAALVGDVDPSATFSQISTWIGEFMSAQVQRAK
jgi:hypothetical protein